jgi:hypothetical protein
VTLRIPDQDKNMKIEILPSYSAEKYYLLSELEQKCHFIYTEEYTGQRKSENNDSQRKTILKEDSILTFFYFLFSSFTTNENDSTHILQNAVQLFNVLSEDACFDPSSSVIVIDLLLVTTADFYDVTFRSRLTSLSDTLKKETGIGLIIIAISDSKGALPGLEKIYDLIERLLPGYSSSSPQQIATIVTPSPSTLLGHDPDSDSTDAVNDIFQALFFSEEDGESSFLLMLFEEKNNKIKEKLIQNKEEKEWVNKKYPRNTKSPENTEKSSNQSSTSSGGVAGNIYIEATVCLIVAIVVYFFARKCLL